MFEHTYSVTATPDADANGSGLITATTPDAPGSFVHNGGWLANRPQRTWHAEAAGATSDGADLPLIYAAKVPASGNYAVTVTLSAPAATTVNVTLGRRHLIARNAAIPANTPQTFSGLTHVGPYIHAAGGQADTDLTVYASVCAAAAVTLLEVTVKQVNVPTVYIAGDSIATDNEAYVPYAVDGHGCGWGQQLELALSGIAVDNQAHNGMTTQTYVDTGNWALIMQQLHAGDIVLLSFGHNDQKRADLTAFGGYATNLRRMVAQVTKAHGLPILLTSLSRIPTSSPQGRYDKLEAYAASVKQIGAKLGVPVIDLHAHSFAALCQLQGAVNLHDYFNDGAHTNDQGAGMVVLWLTQLLLETPNPLAPYITHTPQLQLVSSSTQHTQFGIEQPVAKAATWDTTDIDASDPDLQYALAKHLIDPTVPLYPNTPMPRGDFFYLLPNFAQPFKQRYYNECFYDVDAHDFFADYVQAAFDAHLLDPATTPQGCVRLQAPLTAAELLSVLMRNRLPLTERNISLAQAQTMADALGIHCPTPLTRIAALRTIVAVMRLTEPD